MQCGCVNDNAIIAVDHKIESAAAAAADATQQSPEHPDIEIHRVEHVQDQIKAICNEGWVLVMDGSAECHDDSVEKELRKLAKKTGASLALYEEIPVGAVEEVELKETLRTHKVNPIQAMADEKVSTFDGAVILEFGVESRSRCSSTTLFHFALLKKKI